jgi:hypothetical protein
LIKRGLTLAKYHSRRNKENRPLALGARLEKMLIIRFKHLEQAIGGI